MILVQYWYKFKNSYIVSHVKTGGAVSPEKAAEAEKVGLRMMSLTELEVSRETPCLAYLSGY